jgi:hypothetical protein
MMSITVLFLLGAWHWTMAARLLRRESAAAGATQGP